MPNTTEIKNILADFFNIPTENNVRIDPATGVVSCIGNIVVKNDKKFSKLPVSFGEIKGDFVCAGAGLMTLEGSPTSVTGAFDCTNNKLTTLHGAPRTVGSFHCETNQLSTLDGCPETVTHEMSCDYNQLTSLVGGPTNHMQVGFTCSHNLLTSLEGGPVTCSGDYICSNNRLESLKGAPSKVGLNFDCSHNGLSSLEGGPIRCYDGNYICGNNPIRTLKWLPKMVGRTFVVDWDPDLPLLPLLSIFSSKTPNSSILFQNADDQNNIVRSTMLSYRSMYLENPGKAVMACQEALIDAGFEGNARF